jgi:uncharacterized protein YjbI with pentapeptide repeats
MQLSESSLFDVALLVYYNGIWLTKRYTQDKQMQYSVPVALHRKNKAIYSTLLYATLRYSTLLYATLSYSTLLYATLRYSTLLYATLRYSKLLYATLRYYTLIYSNLR